ncbi:MAG TPA: HPr kinase/phosphatase C-terminal domain-containing protein [Paenirhodobacter sp.]
MDNIHATAVALDADHGVLIVGPSGAGKSELALRLMAFGAHLVADDRVDLRVEDGRLIASCPATLSGMIEMRGIGILGAVPLPQAAIVLVVDLGAQETERLPPHRSRDFLGVNLPLVLRLHRGHLDVAVLQWLKGGRRA